MADLLRAMAEASARRVAEARIRLPEPELRRQALDAPEPPRFRFDPAGFDLLAEIKLRSPSAGHLADPAQDADTIVRKMAAAYAAGGAAAISVLTEPTAFGGSLAHLETARQAAPLPLLRKDFLVDPYQVLEARAAGASGVLLIVRLLEDSRLQRMLDACLDLRLTALVEAFDRNDMARIAALLPSRRGAEDRRILIGVNARDLRSLAVRDALLEELAEASPARFPRVAESGLANAGDAARSASLGYDLALVGTSLMRSGDPAALVAAMIAAGRSMKPGRAAQGG